MLTALLVSLAGGVGAATRFAVDSAIQARVGSDHPWGTTVVNLSGSLLFGLLTGAALGHVVPATLQLVVGVGLLGGYTTFSTASVDTVRLAERRRLGAAALNAGGMAVAALAAAALGWWLGARL